MKLRVPEGCGAVSHQGRNLDIAADNSVEVDDAAWPALSAHGLKPWADGRPGPEIADMTREELLVAVVNASLKASQTIGTEEIRTRLIASEAPAPPFDQGSDEAATAVDANIEIIGTLNRQGLFAFLKAKGVSVALPVTNDELRALARQTLG